MKGRKSNPVRPAEDPRERWAKTINDTLLRWQERGLDLDNVSDGKKTIGDYKKEIKKLKTELAAKSAAAAKPAKGE